MPSYNVVCIWRQQRKVRANGKALTDNRALDDVPWVITNFVFTVNTKQPKMAKHIQFEQFAHIYPEWWSCYLVVAGGR